MLGFGMQQSHQTLPRSLEVLYTLLFCKKCYESNFCSAVHCLKLHPTLDILMTGGRDSAIRVKFFSDTFEYL